MRTKNISVKITLRFPTEKPDENGFVYSKQAVKRAFSNLSKNIPVLYRGDQSETGGIVIGNVKEKPDHILYDEDSKDYVAILDCILDFGGTECQNTKIENGIVTDFNIKAIGISI